MAAKYQTLSTALLDHVLRNTAYSPAATVYAALYTTAPTATTAGTEVSGGSYARQAAAFAAAAAGSISNSGTINFPVASAGWGTVTSAAVCDAVSAGNILYFGNLTASKVVGIGDQLSFAASALTVTES
jgi:hypothetical protein